MDTNELTLDQATTQQHTVDADVIRAAIAKRSFATLATTSGAGWPHAAGVLYATSGDRLFISTLRDSRKARNIAENPRVGVSIPVRRAPVGPPSTITFQGRARLLDLDDPDLRAAATTGDLKAVTGHGELELPGGVFIEITLPSRVVTYGLGMSLLALVRDPMHASGVAYLDAR
jgi:nitroimidazol reductase NimA-like FMN-containing flavoprotein (pyridoxamine 5'-phosphate oxidase superfamily)